MAQSPAKKKGTAVTVRRPASPPTDAPKFVVARAAEDAGKGVSTAQEDNLVPLVYILQSNSPQVNRRGADYIEGAEASAIWLRSASDPIVSGEDGIVFQPCHFSKDWVEWKLRDEGGGFVARHDARPADAEAVADPKNPNKTRFVRPSGNEVVETRYHIGYVHVGDQRLAYVIPMSSTGHSVSREWMFRMNGKSVGGVKAPTFASLYRLRTKERTNAAGTWFTWDISDEGSGWVQSEADYERGRGLHDAFVSGARQAAAPEAPADDDADARRAGI